jgi:hypothetical protein
MDSQNKLITDYLLLLTENITTLKFTNNVILTETIKEKFEQLRLDNKNLGENINENNRYNLGDLDELFDRMFGNIQVIESLISEEKRKVFDDALKILQKGTVVSTEHDVEGKKGVEEKKGDEEKNVGEKDVGEENGNKGPPLFDVITGKAKAVAEKKRLELEEQRLKLQQEEKREREEKEKREREEKEKLAQEEKEKREGEEKEKREGEEKRLKLEQEERLAQEEKEKRKREEERLAQEEKEKREREEERLAQEENEKLERKEKFLLTKNTLEEQFEQINNAKNEAELKRQQEKEVAALLKKQEEEANALIKKQQEEANALIKKQEEEAAIETLRQQEAQAKLEGEILEQKRRDLVELERKQMEEDRRLAQEKFMKDKKDAWELYNKVKKSETEYFNNLRFYNKDRSWIEFGKQVIYGIGRYYDAYMENCLKLINEGEKALDDEKNMYIKYLDENISEIKERINNNNTNNNDLTDVKFYEYYSEIKYDWKSNRKIQFILKELIKNKIIGEKDEVESTNIHKIISNINYMEYSNEELQSFYSSVREIYNKLLNAYSNNKNMQNNIGIIINKIKPYVSDLSIYYLKKFVPDETTDKLINLKDIPLDNSYDGWVNTINIYNTVKRTNKDILTKQNQNAATMNEKNLLFARNYLIEDIQKHAYIYSYYYLLEEEKRKNIIIDETNKQQKALLKMIHNEEIPDCTLITAISNNFARIEGKLREADIHKPKNWETTVNAIQNIFTIIHNYQTACHTPRKGGKKTKRNKKYNKKTRRTHK